jgi:ferric-dicitrate binding protein FerR (iron transport regulator)
MDIKVLGTAFNVRSYPNERTSEAALVRGLVQIIMRQNPGETLFLRPNEKIIINGTPNKGFKNSNQITTEAARIVLTQMHRLKEENSSIETSWVENKLAFDNETLEQIALKLERWFDVKVTVHDTLKESTFYGVFEDEKLDEVLTALQITGNFHFKING